ncbi:hypothetical protein ACE6H2_026001 [Prunus campanulata]
MGCPSSPPRCQQKVLVGLICDVPYYNYKDNDEDHLSKGYSVQVNADYSCRVVRILLPDLFSVSDDDGYDSSVKLFIWRSSLL